MKEHITKENRQKLSGSALKSRKKNLFEIGTHPDQELLKLRRFILKM